MAEKVKLALIGCGAVAEERYLPAAHLASNLVITHLVDLDVERARRVAARFQVPHFTGDYRQLFHQVDAVVVATPPNSHAPISIDCLNNGLAVLCEKPMAPSTADAEKMIAASEQSGALLTVAMVRRLSWSSLLMKKLMDSGMLGMIQRFDIESGEEYKWPLRDGHTFKDSASGGVLADIGPHLLDLLFWFLGSQQARLYTYSDDSWGGVAANATMDLAVQLPGGQVPGRIELSFTRRLRNTLRIYGETGCLEAPLGLNGYEVLFYPGGQEVEPVILKLPGAAPRKNQVTFALQLSHFANLIRGEAQDYVTGGEALATVSMIEQCRRLRKRVAQPWELKHVESFFEVSPHA